MFPIFLKVSCFRFIWTNKKVFCCNCVQIILCSKILEKNFWANVTKYFCNSSWGTNEKAELQWNCGRNGLLLPLRWYSSPLDLNWKYGQCWRLSILLWSLRQKFNPTSYRIRKIFPFDQLFSSKRTVQNNIYKWKIVFYKSISTDFYLTCRKDFWLLFSKLGWKNSNFSFIPSLKKSD